MSDRQTRLIDALRSPQAYPHETGEIRLVETHISFVLLTGRFAYKIKKAVRLPFLDFSTPPLRERFCREELLLNRRLAPEIYLDVVPIGGAPENPRIGKEPAIEHAVRMQQFDDAATADRLLAAGTLEDGELTALAERIAAFHASLEPADAPGAADAVRDNLTELENAFGGRDERLAPLADRLKGRLEALGSALELRRAHGAVRECHGDLHLGNVARVDGRLLPFDCLEFDRSLRTIDVVDEAAFLWMDLAAGGRRDLACAFLDRYLGDTGDYAGLLLLRLFAAHRALVRAKVAALGPDGGRPAIVERYLAAADSALAPDVPRLLLTTGLSGSGKTHVAKRLVRALGAVQIRSDVERKRLHGLAPGESAANGVDAGLYTAEATGATYGRLRECAAAGLAGGVDVIVDAAGLHRPQRDAFRTLAAEQRARFLLLACEAPESVLRERIAARSAAGGDASDATAEVLDHQLATRDAIAADEEGSCLRIDTSGPLDVAALARQIRAGG